MKKEICKYYPNIPCPLHNLQCSAPACFKKEPPIPKEELVTIPRDSWNRAIDNLNDLIKHHTNLNKNVGRDPKTSNTIRMAQNALDNIKHLR